MNNSPYGPEAVKGVSQLYEAAIVRSEKELKKEKAKKNCIDNKRNKIERKNYE